MLLPKSIACCLPPTIIENANHFPIINEIRLRKNSKLCFSSMGKNIVTEYTVTRSDIDFCVNAFCKNSVHTYFDYITQGFIPLDDGSRIGVCGKAVTEKGVIQGLGEINSLNIRIPTTLPDFPIGLFDKIPLEKGILCYSAPNVGKTTFLKKVISILSNEPFCKKLCVIDPKHEFIHPTADTGQVDYFIGYPKFQAIDIAIRNMSPEIIICDEIGLNDDISVLTECKNCGVSLICSAHAGTLEELFSRDNIKTMHDLKIFQGYMGISIKDGQRYYLYTDRGDVRC